MMNKGNEKELNHTSLPIRCMSIFMAATLCLSSAGTIAYATELSEEGAQPLVVEAASGNEEARAAETETLPEQASVADQEESVAVANVQADARALVCDQEGAASIEAAEDTSAVVTFRDENLLKAVCAALDKDYKEGISLTENDMARLTQLKAENAEITDLTGLNKAVNLEKLDLSGNPLDDLKRYERGDTSSGFCSTLLNLKSLSKLKELDLSGCKLGENYSGSAVYLYLKTPGVPENLIEVLESLNALETLNLSNNGFAGMVGFYIGINGFNNLKSLDLSNNRLSSVDGMTNRYLKTLEHLDLSNNYVFWDERDGSWHSALMENNSVVTRHENQKNLADQHIVYYAGNGASTTSYSNFNAAVIDPQSKEIDLGTFCGGNLTIALGGFANTNSTKATIEGTKFTASSFANINTISDANYQYTFNNIADGDYTYPIEVMHMGGDRETYILKFSMRSVPADSESAESAGVKDISLQYAVCKSLGKLDEISTYVVTKEDMATLRSLSISNVSDASGLEYATNLTTLTVNGTFSKMPDLGALTKLKSLSVVSPNLTEPVDVSNNTALTRLTISETIDGALSDVSKLSGLTGLVINYSKNDAIPEGLGNCTKLTSYTLQYPSGYHRFPAEVVAKNKLSYTITRPAEGSEFSFEGAESAQIPNLTVTCNNYEAAKNIRFTGISEKTTNLTNINIAAGAIDGMLPDSVGEAPNLETMSLKGAVSELPESLAGSNITTLSLSDPAQLPLVVEKMKALKKLTVSGCKYISDDIDLSGTSLSNLTINNQSELTKVPSAEHLPETLEKIDLSSNKITEMSGSGYEKLKNLTDLNLSANYFTKFPVAVNQIPHLTSLNLGLNFYGDIPADAFDSMTSLSIVTLGSMLPVKMDADYNFTLDESASEATKSAIAKATEITSSNNGMIMLEGAQPLYYGISYAALASMDSSAGSISNFMPKDFEYFTVLGEDVSSITLTPTALYDDTVITCNGKEYKSGEQIVVDGLVEGTNEIEITCFNPRESFAQSEKTVTYHLKVYCGTAVSADRLEDGHTYRIDYKLYKSGQSVESMSSSYFLDHATVRYKDGKYEVRITTNKSSYISDLDYLTADGTRSDAELVESDTVNDTATYRIFTDSLSDLLVVSPFVVPMGYYPQCDLVFNTNNIIDITDSLPSVDMADLNVMINKALEVTEKNNVYTEKSYSKMLVALEEAQKIAEGTLPVQFSVDAAKDALAAAIDGLEVDESKLANKLTLGTTLDEARAIVKGNHTDTAWNALQEAIGDAQSVFDMLEARQGEVDAAVRSLTTAVTLFTSSGEASTLDKNNLQDGIYAISADMIKTDRVSKSMADNAINHTMKLEVKNGEYFITLDFRGITIENRFGYLKNLSYYTNGYAYGAYGTIEGTTEAAHVLSTQKDSAGKDIIDQYNDASTLYPDLVQIKLVPQAIADAEGYVPLHVFVPIMEAIAAGNGDQDVLMKLDWTTLKKASAEDPDFKPEDPVQQSPAIEVTDAATGVRVSADKGVFAEGTRIAVSAITSGVEHDNAAKALSEVGTKFSLYNLSSSDSDGNEVYPNGPVTISLPIPSGSDASKLALYRINDDGSKTLIRGAAADGAYTFTTRTMASFALVEEASAVESGAGKTNTNVADKNALSADKGSRASLASFGGGSLAPSSEDGSLIESDEEGELIAAEENPLAADLDRLNATDKAVGNSNSLLSVILPIIGAILGLGLIGFILAAIFRRSKDAE